MSFSLRVENLRKVYRSSWIPAAPKLMRAAMNLSGFGGHEQSIPISRRKVALHDVSFSVSEGERVGVIGENGAGKSTLLHLIAGISRPSAGRAIAEGRVHALLTLGVGLREEATGRENLFIDGELQGKSRRELAPLVDEMIAFSELEAFADRPVRTYSSGMKARLVFAGLIFLDPEILLIDETLSVGDAWFARKASQAIRDLCDRGRIVLIVSHSMDSIKEYCSRCLWLDQGRVVADGEPAQVTTQYLDYVRARDSERYLWQTSDETDQWAASPEAVIDDFFIFSAGGNERRNVLFSGQEVAFNICTEISRNLREPNVRLQFYRFDGLFVADNCMSDASSDIENLLGRKRIVFSVGSLPLGAGLYTARAELMERDTSVAWRSCIFKVESEISITGGVPALALPIRVSARPAEEIVE